MIEESESFFENSPKRESMFQKIDTKIHQIYKAISSNLQNIPL